VDRSHGNSASDIPWSLHNGQHHFQAILCHLPHNPVSCLTEDINLWAFFVFPDADEEMEDEEDEMGTDEDI
jgi:hypothetical protein